jgi:hypothetical protein
MRTCHSAVDWVYPQEMPGSVVARWRWVKGRKLGDIRDGRPGYNMLPHGGWHLSWLGGPDAQRQKAARTCHLELPHSEVAILTNGSGYRTGHHVDVDMKPVDVDETWPAYIYQRRCPDSWFRPRGGEYGNQV